jgi:formyl-CoA transferase
VCHSPQYRNRTGLGQQVDTSLLDAGVALSVWEATEYFAGVGVPTALGSAHRMVAPYQAVRCADGYITIGASNDRTFRRLCGVLGHSEWADEHLFLTNASRVANRDALAARIETVTSQQPRAHWLAALDANRIPSGPINTYSQVFSDAQVVDREMVVDVEHPALGSIRALGSPIKMSATPPDVRRCAPRLGEHTEEVLREAGFSLDEIRRLRPDDAIFRGGRNA